MKERTLLPFTIETFGPWGEEATKFSTTGEIRLIEFFKVNLTIAIQRGNGANVKGSFDSSRKLDDFFLYFER